MMAIAEVCVLVDYRIGGVSRAPRCGRFTYNLPVEPEQSYTNYRSGAPPVRLGDRHNCFLSESLTMRARTPALPVCRTNPFPKLNVVQALAPWKRAASATNRPCRAIENIRRPPSPRM